MPMKIFNKLVRDKIPDICTAENQKPDFYKITDDADYLKHLLLKLAEETGEMTQTPSVEEAADIFEVLLAIGRLKNFTETDLLRAAQEKCGKKGGFSQRYFLRSIDEKI